MPQECLYRSLHFLGVISVAMATCVVNDMPTQPDFNINKFMGKWYEVRYKPYAWEDVSQIYTDYEEMYTAKEIGTEVSYVGSGRFANADTCNTHTGNYKIDEQNPAKWTVSKYFNSTARVMVDYWILNTDYDNYAFVYGCEAQKEDGTCDEAHAWVWSRTNNLTEAQQTLVEDHVTESCLDSADLLHLEQEKYCDSTSGAGKNRLLTCIVLLQLCLIGVLSNNR